MNSHEVLERRLADKEPSVLVIDDGRPFPSTRVGRDRRPVGPVAHGPYGVRAGHQREKGPAFESRRDRVPWQRIPLDPVDQVISGFRHDVALPDLVIMTPLTYRTIDLIQ
jgi:hypothetical protein